MAFLGKEYQGSFVSNPRFNYLEERDRFLSAAHKPKYRFNIIGTGIMGQEHMRVTMLEGRAMIHGIYDKSSRSMQKAREMFAFYYPDTNLIEYNSLKDACNDPEVDGLIICTPNYSHIDVVKEAVKSGKHILLEKPMATTLKDAFEITQIAKDYQAIFQIGLQYRYKSIYVEAIHEALERKALGEIKMVSILEHRIPFLDKVDQWNKFSKYSGGTLVEKCCHYFDLMNLFAESRPVSVYAVGSMAVNFKGFKYNNEKSDIVDNAFVTVTYENGVKTSFNLCMFAPMFYEEIIICGDEGRIKAYENEDFLTLGRPRNHFEIMGGLERPSKVTSPSYSKDIELSGHSGGTYYEHKYFIDNIEGKGTNTATVDDGFWSVVVGVAAEESIKTGKVVDVSTLLKEKGINIRE